VNVGQTLRQAALRWPDDVAIVELDAGGGRREHTYGALDEGARRVAFHLGGLGLSPGDRLGLLAENGRPFIETWFGGVYAGLAMVPLPILSAAPEIAHRLAHAGCRALVVDTPRRAVAERAAAAVDHEVTLLHPAALSRAAVALEHPLETRPDDTAMVLYTSGTTGRAKGAVITHASLMTHTAALVHHTLRLGRRDRVLGALPLTHSYGIRMVVLCPFYAGARAVLLPRFDATRVAPLLDGEGITWLPAVPTMLAAIARTDGAPPSSLRWCLSAGAPLVEEVRLAAEHRLGAEVRQGYGLTEATFSTVDAPPGSAQPGSVGRPVWGIEVRIVDEQGREREPGEEGQIQIRGHNVMRGYLDDEAATREVFQDGWLSTGDVGQLDHAGTLTVVDRLKDLIIRGGNNVYPSEVEDALATHPGVAEVAVVGRPDPYWGEEVVAVIVPVPGARPGASEIADWARERLARTKAPREVALVRELPLGPSGKVLKRALRAQITSGELALEPVAPTER
jgi:long-chain acyl-CoA synthetase